MIKNSELLEQHSIVDINYPIYQYIYQLIYIRLRFKSSYIGSHYLSTFIEDIIQDDKYLYNLSPTKDIYPMIAKKFKTKANKVERAIRYSCTDAWENIDGNIKKQVFPNGDESIPTNSEMIYAIYEYIKGHYIFDEDSVRKNVYYKNNVVREETENYIDYKIRFEIQKLLYQKFKFSFASFKYLSIWIDAVLLSVKANKILMDEDISGILRYLNDTYKFYEGTYYSYLGGVTDVNEIEGIVLSFCNRIYERRDETFSLQKPKDKTYIKEYMNNISSRVQDKLPFHI